MFAVVQVGNNQFKVSEGDVISANRLDFDKGQSIVLDKVMLFSDGKNVKVGNPYIKGMEIKADVLEHNRGDKVVAYHYRKRKDSARTRGHRQDLTSLKISKIAA